MLRSSELAAWLTGLLPQSETAPIIAGPLLGISEEPDRIVAIVRQGGNPPADEGIRYTIAFHVRVRGAQRDYDSAELLTDTIDDLLLGAQMPAFIGASRVIAIAALARPAHTATDTAERAIIDSAYQVTTPR